MLRKGFALALSFAVPLAALCAPPAHAHVDDHATEHHDESAVHAHYSPHSSHTPAHDHAESDRTRSTRVGEHDEDPPAVFLQLFVAVPAQTFVLAAVVPPVLTLTPPVDAGFPPQFRVVHGHDPPFLKSLPSRAPPSFLS